MSTVVLLSLLLEHGLRYFILVQNEIHGGGRKVILKASVVDPNFFSDSDLACL